MTLELNAMIADMKRHPRFHEAGMILCHNGVVRGSSRDGRKVRGLRVKVDHGRLEAVVAEQKRRPGILDIRVAIAEGRDLAVGDDVMILVVAGDFRENVVSVLADTLNLLKDTVTAKTEYFA
jgi:molybdopterin synthase catalytic subunit